MTHPEQHAVNTLLSASSLGDIAREVPGQTVRSVQKILASVRHHLDMDVAFVSEFVGRKRYFRNVDAKGRTPLHVGDSMALSDGYCQRVVEGSLPELIVDTAHNALASSLPDTIAVPIGSHLSVPIRLKDGRIYGTFCCFSFEADQTLNERDLGVMRAFAEVAAYQIEAELEAASSRNEKSRRILAALDRDQPASVFQPLVTLDEMQLVGVECLSRFDMEPYRGPDRWFAEATEVGHGIALELQAIRNALGGLARRGIDRSLQVWINVSAVTVIAGDVLKNLGGIAPDRIVLELTEHEHVADYASLDRALQPLRDHGMAVAIDDAGAGYASMSHILNISPDYIKLDLSLTRRIDADRKRRALAAALIEFGKQTDAKVVAEGVESVAELDELRRLGAHLAQGYFICEPVSADALIAVLDTFAGRREPTTS